MTARDLQRAVARATGEDIDTIASLGFSLLEEDGPDEDDLVERFLDWDDVDHRRSRSVAAA